MKKNAKKTIAVICCIALLFSMTSCTAGNHGGSSHSGGRTEESGSKREGGRTTDPTYPTDPTDPTLDPTTSPTTDPTSDPTPVPSGNNGNYIPTSEELTYPDHVATVDEVHPFHKKGDISGTDAQTLLSEVEYEIMHHVINCYVDADILFENPEDFGFDMKDVSWGDFVTIDEYDDEKAFYQEQLDQLLLIDYETLGGDDRLCYDKLVYDCEECVYSYSYTAFEYYTMIFNYLVGPQSEVLFICDVITFDTVEDAENYITLLKDLDRYYDLMCEYEETRVAYGFASSDNSYEEAAVSFDNLVKQKDDCFLYESFEERLDNIKGLSSSDRERLIKENEKAMKDYVFPEFEECARRMRALKGSGGVDAGLCQYRGGDAYYEFLTRKMTNSNATVKQSMNALDKEIQAAFDDMIAITTANFGAYTNFLTHKFSKGDINDNLDYLRDAVKNDFPDIPSHDYYIMDVPEVFEENFSPAAYLGFHLDNYNANVMIVNNSAVDDDFGITVAHEGYPGHMFQSLYTRGHTDHPYMYLGESTGYLEGWATYVEYYSIKYYDDSGDADVCKLAKYNSSLSLLMSTRVDYGIHVENWSLNDCLDYFNGFGFGLTEDDFSKFYTLIVTDPGYYAKYGMGYYWTQKTMDDMHAKYPNASDKEIHTAYLDSLTGTFEQINKNMDSLLG